MIYTIQPQTLNEQHLQIQRDMQQQPRTLGCAVCPELMAAAAGLGCTPSCDKCQHTASGMGALDFSSAGLGAGTIGVIAVAAVAWYALRGLRFQVRRRKLMEAKTRYKTAVADAEEKLTKETAEVKRKYGRLRIREA